MHESFYLNRSSGWHALHPLTKLAAALAILVTAFSVRWMFVSVALFVLVVLPLAGYGRIWREVLHATFTIILPLAVSLALVQGFFYPGAQEVLWQMGPFALKREGLEFAFVTGTRLVVIASVGLLVVYATHPADLALALVQAGAPFSLAYIAVTAIQLLPEMQGRAASILNAQQARGLETQGNLLVRVRAFFPLIAPLVYGALENVQERALALDARAFRAPRAKTSWRELQDSPAQRASRWLLVSYAIVLLLISLALPLVSLISLLASLISLLVFR
ncbi:MAG: energy-coupling factor transporter transmembrane protein EcfT [Chloroflexi bacterium]|nr:energy-coupling factor transporter transmembrane protein EcfT [Chloroflexota bacterium]